MLGRIAAALFSISGMWAFTGDAAAEGGCPPGRYPIGGQGVQGCAPIPSNSAPMAPRPDGKWITTWGAIASSASTGSTGVSTGKRRKSEALGEAMTVCARKGATDCKEDITYKNGCVALVDPPVGSSFQGGIATAATVERALELATQRCREGGAPTCTVVHTNCSEPIFKRF